MQKQKVTKVQLGTTLGAGGIAQNKVQKANQFLKNTEKGKVNMPDLEKVANLLGTTTPALLLGNPEVLSSPGHNASNAPKGEEAICKGLEEMGFAPEEIENQLQQIRAMKAYNPQSQNE